MVLMDRLIAARLSPALGLFMRRQGRARRTFLVKSILIFVDFDELQSTFMSILMDSICSLCDLRNWIAILVKSKAEQLIAETMR